MCSLVWRGYLENLGDVFLGLGLLVAVVDDGQELVSVDGSPRVETGWLRALAGGYFLFS